MESLGYINRDIINAILHSTLAEGVKEVYHLATVFDGDLFRL